MRIGELADRLGINPKTIRFYESVGLLRELDRASSGYRHYSGIDVDRLTFIKTAQYLNLALCRHHHVRTRRYGFHWTGKSSQPE